MSYPFNIRVYGILIKENNLLVSHEYFFRTNMIKFPGGGLQFGEGTKEAVVREFKEELNITIEVKSHLYTTDFFIPSAFEKQKQIISIYYLVDSNETISKSLFKQPLGRKEDYFYLSWIPVCNIEAQLFTFPGDQKAFEIIKKVLSKKPYSEQQE
ncbi:MAG: NUDIX domain-containing protein [Bacteroidia bacterium]|nr:NUDIX domain-containing protein [Bacteroidia bacterium]MCZ2277595.1 NUDIX domain-containing protein [Bacteroidia bacterium]